MLLLVNQMTGGGCPFSAAGISILAAIAGVSTLVLNSKFFTRLALAQWGQAPLPRGVERNATGHLWFREVSEFWEGQAFSIEISKV